MKKIKSLMLVMLIGAATLLAACGGGGDPANMDTASETLAVTKVVPTISLLSSPSTLPVGSSANLVWVSTNAVQCIGTEGLGHLPMQGERSVTISKTTTYEVTCRSQTGATATASVTITVASQVAAADVTFIQLETSALVTPGEKEVRLTTLAVTCKLAVGSDTYCAKQVPLGEMGIQSPVPLVPGSIMVTLNGQSIDGRIEVEDNLYRFVPMYHVEVYEVGVLEVFASVSPHAANGKKGAVEFYASEATWDATLEVKSATAKIETFTRTHLAPIEVSNATKIGLAKVFGTMGTVSIGCPRSVTAGCRVGFDVNVGGATLGSPLQVYVDDETVVNYIIEYDEFDYVTVTDIRLSPGQTVIVRIVGIVEQGYLYLDTWETYSGDKPIEPKLPDGCSIANQENCKG